MMKHVIHFVVLFSLAFPCHDVAARSAAVPELIEQAVARTGQQYREAVKPIVQAPEAKETLGSVIESEPDSSMRNLVARVLLARISQPETFAEYEGYVQTLRTRLMTGPRRPKILGREFSNALFSFANKGPESKFASIRTGTKWIGILQTGQYEQVEKYTEEEVHAGKSRNRAVRLAILEHFLKFSAEGSEYEQYELVHAVHRLWDSEMEYERHDEDGIPVKQLLREVCDDETRPLSVRAAALQCLSREDRAKRERQLMLAIARSEDTTEWRIHGKVVGSAVRYLKEHAPDSLKDIKSKTYWKQQLINDAAGLPPPPRPKEARCSVKPEDQGLDIE